MYRIERSQMMLEMARVIAKRSTCSRLQVGAIVARDSRCISTGYNGNAHGIAHCVHLPGSTEPCNSAVHAEMNAIAAAARYGVSTEGTSLWVTHMPCLNCAKLIVNSGIIEVIFENGYRDQSGFDLIVSAGIQIGRAKRDGSIRYVTKYNHDS